MIYSNYDLEKSFGIKIISVKTSLISEKTDTLEYKGSVLALCRKPETRTIDVDVLLKTSNSKDLYSKSVNLAEFLETTSFDKLILNETPNQYYLAKCIEISQPTITGSSSKFSLKFKCKKNYAYNLSNDKPIINVEEISTNFTYANKHCLNDLGLVFIQDSISILPKSSGYIYKIDGVDGTIRSDGIRLEELSLKGDLFVTNKDYTYLSSKDLNSKIREIKRWLHQSSRERLIFDNDLEYYYLADCFSEINIKNDKWELGSIPVEFVLQPYKYSCKETVIEKQLVFDTGSKIEFDSSSFMSDYEADFLIQIINQGSVPLTNLGLFSSNNDSISISITPPLNTNDSLIFRSNNYTAVASRNNVGESVSKYVQINGKLLKFGNGINISVLTTDDTSKPNIKAILSTRGKF